MSPPGGAVVSPSSPVAVATADPKDKAEGSLVVLIRFSQSISIAETKAVADVKESKDGNPRGIPTAKFIVIRLLVVAFKFRAGKCC